MERIRMHNRSSQQFQNLPFGIKVLADEVIQKLFSDYTSGKPLVGPFRGLRSTRVTIKYRIIYCQCSDCRTNDWVKFNQRRCGNCDDFNDDSLHIHAIGPRKGIYKKTL